MNNSTFQLNCETINVVVNKRIYFQSIDKWRKNKQKKRFVIQQCNTKHLLLKSTTNSQISKHSNVVIYKTTKKKQLFLSSLIFNFGFNATSKRSKQNHQRQIIALRKNLMQKNEKCETTSHTYLHSESRTHSNRKSSTKA